MSRDRFKELKDEYDESIDEEEGVSISDAGMEGSTAGDRSTSDDGSTGDTSDTGVASDTGEEKDSGDYRATATKGNVKERNPSISMYPPAEHKQRLDETWGKIEAVCNLSGREKPTKLSEFSAAILKHGYEDLEVIAHELGLEDVYEEYSDVIERD